MARPLPPDTVATMSHGRLTIQARWVEGVTKYRALAWGVNGEAVDANRLGRLIEGGDQDAATLAGFFKMGAAGHVSLPWRLTEYGKDLAGECPCGPCTWEDPPVRERKRPTPPKAVNAKERRRIRRERQRRTDEAVAQQLAAASRREAELRAELREARRLRAERLARIVAEARAEGEARGRAAAEREAATRWKLSAAGKRGAAAVARGPSGRFVKGAKR